MQFTPYIAFAILSFTGSVFASPVVRDLGKSIVTEKGTITAKRGSIEGVEVSLDDVKKNVQTVVDTINEIGKFVHQHDIEAQFTQSTVDRMLSTFNDKNVIVYHNQLSHTHFINGVDDHEEQDIGGFGATQGYEVWVFDSGSFDLVGDGGYINWCFGGNYKRDGNHVEFFPIGSQQPSKSRRGLQKAVTYSYDALPGSNNTHNALHAPVTYTPLPPPVKANIPPNTPTSTKGPDDGYHFLQCRSNNGTLAQGLAYYKNLQPHGGNRGQQPDEFMLLAETGRSSINSSTAASSHDVWRFPMGAIEFPKMQSTVHWNLFGNADSDHVTTNMTAGTAENGNEQFWMFKDDGEQLFTKDQWNCDSLYYAW